MVSLYKYVYKNDVTRVERGGIFLRRTREQAEKTRSQVLDTFLDMFIENGFSKTSLTSIAHRLGVTKGAIYWHFKNKEDILLHIVKRHCGLVLQDAVNSLADSQSDDTLYSFYEMVLNRPISDECYVKLYRLLRENHKWPEEIRTAIFKMFDDVLYHERSIVTDYISRAQESGMMRGDIEAEKVAVVITSIFNGLGMLQTNGRLPDEFLKYNKLLFDSFSRTLASLKL